MDFIGGKWKASLLYVLLEGRKRFSELNRQFPKITQRTLTRQLRELEADGLIGREVFAEVPPRVEYRILEKGLALRPALNAMFAWGVAHALNDVGEAVSRTHETVPDDRERRARSGHQNGVDDEED